MRRITIAAGLACVLTSSYAPARVVLFDPPEVAFDPTDPARVYEFAVTVDSEPGGATMAQGVDILFGTDTMTFRPFEYSEQFESAAAFTTSPGPIPIFPWPNDFVGGFLTTPLAMPFTIGTLTAQFDLHNIDWKADPPEYAIFVDSVLDGDFSNLNGEPLTGYVRLVPEPATALLLLAGASALSARRRTKESTP